MFIELEVGGNYKQKSYNMKIFKYLLITFFLLGCQTNNIVFDEKLVYEEMSPYSSARLKGVKDLDSSKQYHIFRKTIIENSQTYIYIVDMSKYKNTKLQVGNTYQVIGEMQVLGATAGKQYNLVTKLNKIN